MSLQSISRSIIILTPFSVNFMYFHDHKESSWASRVIRRSSSIDFRGQLTWFIFSSTYCLLFFSCSIMTLYQSIKDLFSVQYMVYYITAVKKCIAVVQNKMFYCFFLLNSNCSFMIPRQKTASRRIISSMDTFIHEQSGTKQMFHSNHPYNVYIEEFFQVLMI